MNEEFRLSRCYKYIALLGIIFFLVMGIITISHASKDSHWISFSIIAFVFFLFSLFSFKLLRICDDYVRINEQGITYLSKNSNDKTLAWENIQDIKDNYFSQSLTLYDQRGFKIMNLVNQLEQSSRLRQLIIDHAPRLQKKFSQIRIFHPHPFNRIVLIGGDISCIFVGWLLKNKGLWLLCLGFILMTLYSLVRELPYRISISQDNIIIFYLFRQRKIELSQINKVRLINKSNNNGGDFSHVVLELNSPKRFEFPFVKEGSIALSESIKHVLRENAKEYI